MSERENKLRDPQPGNFGRLAYMNVARAENLAHENIPAGYVLVAAPNGEVEWAPSGGGGGGSGTIVYQPGGTAYGNVVVTWADVVAALAVVSGHVIVQIDTQYAPASIPTGNYDLTDVTLLGSDCGERVTLTLSNGVTFTGGFPILRGLRLISESSEEIMHVQGGDEAYVCLFNSTMETTDTPIIYVSPEGSALFLSLADRSELIRDVGPVVHLQETDAYLRVGSESVLRAGTVSGSGDSAVEVDTLSETATVFRQTVGFSGFWDFPVRHYNRTVVYQAAHGFTVNQVLSRNAGAWVLANANVATAGAVCVVTEVLDADHFVTRTEGWVDVGAHGLSVGQVYYLSATTPGALSLNPSGYAQRVLRVTGATEYVIQFSEADRPDYIYDRRSGGAGTRYYGFYRIDDNRWLAKRQVTAAGVVTETYANKGNNPTYDLLDDAWPDRTTLAYVSYGALVNL